MYIPVWVIATLLGLYLLMGIILGTGLYLTTPPVDRDLKDALVCVFVWPVIFFRR